jgi:hypothetical protein
MELLVHIKLSTQEGRYVIDLLESRLFSNTVITGDAKN